MTQEKRRYIWSLSGDILLPHRLEWQQEDWCLHVKNIHLGVTGQWMEAGCSWSPWDRPAAAWPQSPSTVGCAHMQQCGYKISEVMIKKRKDRCWVGSSIIWFWKPEVFEKNIIVPPSSLPPEQAVLLSPHCGTGAVVISNVPPWSSCPFFFFFPDKRVCNLPTSSSKALMEEEFKPRPNWEPMLGKAALPPNKGCARWAVVHMT